MTQSLILMRWVMIQQIIIGLFVKGIKGSYNNLVSGMPLEAVIEMLFAVGYQFSLCSSY